MAKPSLASSALSLDTGSIPAKHNKMVAVLFPGLHAACRPLPNGPRLARAHKLGGIEATSLKQWTGSVPMWVLQMTALSTVNNMLQMPFLSQWTTFLALPSSGSYVDDFCPGCATVSCPRTPVVGTEGGSLSIHCCYEKKFKENIKYWCRQPAFRPCNKIVDTSKLKTEKESGRVSISDHPANLSFTVTLRNLRMRDAGMYWCGIYTTILQDKLMLDPTSQVEVIVSSGTPGETLAPGFPVLAFPHTSTNVKDTDKYHFNHSLHSHSGRSTCGVHSAAHRGVQVLLSFLAVLLFLLVGGSLVVWRMVRRQIKAAKNAEPTPSLPQPTELSEPCYENVELQTRPSGRAPENQKDTEVEYSTVAAPRAEPHYTSVAFKLQNQDSEATSSSSKRPQEETEYSVVKKT
ncbi:PREDICTED: CMRF35-like molecule 8 [Chrysochloris asiatica]|uniref:CMRF35-like molecule 8 n=1 Tax=Chrysochloris asiatica TaxID=185453 RepID=A0A9B0TXR6_CHRAS|nr:PREDICTED: CMRF35-like molecule 8 [Chrysochloris asiatica]